MAKTNHPPITRRLTSWETTKMYCYLKSQAVLEGNRVWARRIDNAFCSPLGAGGSLQGEAAALYERLLTQLTPSEN